ncbi:MAG: winged helix-turn-helix domain-containing protein [Natronomonas sp.]
MSDPTTDPPETDDVTALVDRNGLLKLFANRTRARILVTLLYADRPLTPAEIAAAADIYESTVREAIDPLGAFEIIEERDDADSEHPRYRLEETDELVEEIRAVAELSTRRLYGEE